MLLNFPGRLMVETLEAGLTVPEAMAADGEVLGVGASVEDQAREVDGDYPPLACRVDSFLIRGLATGAPARNLRVKGATGIPGDDAVSQGRYTEGMKRQLGAQAREKH